MPAQPPIKRHKFIGTQQQPAIRPERIKPLRLSLTKQSRRDSASPVRWNRHEIVEPSDPHGNAVDAHVPFDKVVKRRELIAFQRQERPVGRRPLRLAHDRKRAELLVSRRLKLTPSLGG